jgi:hypothetical protein
MSSHKHVSTVKKVTADGEDRIEEAMEGKAPVSLHDLGGQVAEEMIKTRLLIAKHAKEVTAAADITEDFEVVKYLKDRMTVLLAAFNCIQRSPKLALEIGAEGMESMLGYLSKKAQERAAEAEVDSYITTIQNKLPGTRLHTAASLGGGLIKADGSKLSASEAKAANLLA